MNLFSLKIARKYIFSKKSYSAVNLISIVAVCGIIITVTAMICVLSVFNGFSELVKSKLDVIDPDIRINAVKGKTIANSDSIINLLKAVDGVKMVVPTIQDNALATFGQIQKPVILKGVPDEFDQLTGIRKLIKSDGEFLLSDQYDNYAILSVGCAIEMQARPGYMNKICLFVPKRKGRINLSNPIGAFRSDTLAISGVFQTDQEEIDLNTIIIPIKVAQHLFNYKNEVTDLEIAVNKGYDVHKVIDHISTLLGEDYAVKDRLMQQESMFKIINIEKWITLLLLAFIMIIATFNVISTISVLIVEKKKDIAILTNLGASKSFITRIFTSQTWFITLWGAIIGLAVGLTLCFLQQTYGFIKFAGDPANLIIDAYPVKVEFIDIFVVLGITVVISILSSLVTSAVMRSRLK